ncbi:MAG TPA: hypothetical protein VF910_07730 [Candidatus Bathyarchaeia archaeon]
MVSGVIGTLADSTTGRTMSKTIIQSTISFGVVSTFFIGTIGCDSRFVTESTVVGDFILVVVGFDDNIDSVLSMTDNVGTPYGLVAALTGNKQRIETWGGFAPSSNPNNQITIGARNAFYTCGLMAASYKGVGSSSTIQTSSGFGTSATTTLTTVNAKSWVIGGAMANGTATLSAGANTNVRQSQTLTGCTGNNLCMGEDQVDSGVVTSPASVTLATTIGSSETWTSAAVEIDPVVSTPNANIIATPGMVPVVQLIPFTFAALVLAVLAYDFVQKRTPGGL